MERENSRERRNKEDSRRPLGLRILAVMLAISMMLTSSGVQVMAANLQSDKMAQESTAAETATVTPAAEIAETTGEESPDIGTSETSITETPQAEAPETAVTETPATETPEAEPTATEKPVTGTPAPKATVTETPIPEATVTEIPTPEPSVKKAAARRAAAQTGTSYIDLTEYLIQQGSSMTINIDGDRYTLEQIKKNNLEVPQGAPVEVNLKFGRIEKVTKDTVLTYQIPADMVNGFTIEQSGEIKDGDVVAGTYTIDLDGFVKLVLTDEYLADYKEEDGTTILKGGAFTFEGSFSEQRGEIPGNDDNVIKFGNVSFDVPFDYINYYANVNITKEVDHFDPSTRRVYYKITVSTPETNQKTATNVIVKDVFNSVGTKYMYYYFYVSSSNYMGTFNSSSGTWTIDTMKPGTTATLTYYKELYDSYFTATNVGEIENTATLSFNRTGKKEASVGGSYHNVLNIYKNNSSASNGVETDENGNAYILYTVTVTAPASNDTEMTGITAEDVFTTNKDAISGYQNIELSQGSISKQDTTSLTWDVGALKPGATATMTYRAMINPGFWAQVKTDSYQRIYNGATVKANGSQYDYATSYAYLYKNWIGKTGEQVTEGKYAGGIKFTIKANSDQYGTPILDQVQYFQDELSGTFEYVDNIELTGYSSSDKKVICVTGSVPIKDIESADGSSWKLDLTDTKYSHLKGAYYYELVYYAMPKEGSSAKIASNDVILGVWGWTGSTYTTYKHSASWGGGGGFSFSYSKKYQGGLVTGESSWRTTIPVDIPKGATYVDYPASSSSSTSPYVSYNWFTEDNIAGIRVMFDGQELVRGTGEGEGDYYVTTTTPSSAGKISKYTIIFNKAVTGVTDAKPVTIEYNMHCNVDSYKTTTSNSSKIFYNVSQLTMYGITKNVGTFARYYYRNEMTKTAGSFNTEDNTITWTLEVNRGSSFAGDATIKEKLPDGLSFVSAEITAKGEKADNTQLGTPTDENGNAVTEDTGTVLIPVSGLWQYADRTSSSTSLLYGGKITVKITTKVKDGELLKMAGSSKSYTNTATLEAGKYSITRSDDIELSGSSFSKSYQYDSKTYPYIKYTLTTNSDGLNLLANSDTITIVDEMTSAMRLAIEKSGYFVVTSNGTDITSRCTLIDNTNIEGDNHFFKVIVPDDCPVTIEYYVSVSGVAGEEVLAKNSAHYEGQSAIPGSSVEKEVQVQASSASVSTGARFTLLKVDQSRNPLPNVKFTLYKVELDDDGKAKLDADGLPVLSEIQERVTDQNGKLTFSGSLEENDLYCYIETETPAGFSVNPVRHYVEFIRHENAGISDIAGIVKDATLPVTNYFNGTSYQIPVVKSINGTDTLESTKEFRFTLVPADGQTSWTENTYNAQFTSGTASIKGSGRTYFDPLYFSTEGTYQYTLTENDLGATEGYTKDDSIYHIKFVVEMDTAKNGLVVTKASFWKEGETKEQDLSTAAPVFDNTYDAGGTVVLNATKELAGNRAKAIQNGEFTFTVTENGRVVTTGETLEGGEVKFKEITYTQADIGMHTYVISEDKGSDSTIYYTSETVTVTVKVSNGGNGKLKAEVTYPEDGARFVNEYRASGSAVLSATKKLTGNRAQTIQAGEFKFTVTEGDQKITTGETLEGGEVKFKEIAYTQADIGIHTYVVSEEKGSDSSIVYSSETKTVTVEVSDAGNGKLNTKVTYPEDGMEFVNTYHASGKVVLNATKKLTGNRAQAIQENEFTFLVTENGEKAAEGATQEGGAVKFTEITYTQADIGTHTYVISEEKGKDSSIQYSSETKTVTVEVSDAGSGKLNTTITYPENGMEFVNAYSAKGSVELTAEKELTGNRAQAIQENEFTFLVTENGEKAAEGATLAGGEVKFTEIQYDQTDIGTHEYVITENPGTDSSIAYKASPVTVTVVVSDAGKGKLNTEVTYPSGGAKFVNEYQASGELGLTAAKELTGGRTEAIKKGEFTFKVTEGNTEVATGETLAGGVIEFSKIKYTQADIGTHEYVISEDKGTDPTITYTTDTVSVTVKVIDAGAGKLNIETTYPSGGAKFVNEYHASGSVILEATKELTGGRTEPISKDEFTFTVTENGTEEVATGATQRGGAVKFTEIVYTQADIGTHTYVISEDKGTDPTITYTTETVTVTVTVSDGKNGKLNTEVQYPEGGAKFVNTYHATGEVELTATKILNGNRAQAIQAGEFTFKVTEGNTEVATGETLAGGTVKFTKINYTQADIGTHTYVITEEVGKDTHISYTASPVTVKVTVSDAGKGKLQTDVEYPIGGAKFVNQYSASGVVELTAMKELAGSRSEEIKADEFTFTVKENGEEVTKGATLEGGVVKFEEIEYTQADIGTHTYVISEDLGEEKTIAYTAEPVEITVQVSDAGEGQLKTEVTYPEGGAKFVNEYRASGFVELTAIKKLTGGRAAKIGKDEFTFLVKEDGEEVTKGATLEGGVVKFEEIEYTQADIGTHTYVISEETGQEKTIGYTASPVEVTVQVSDAGEGQLKTEVTYPEGGAVFVNEYHAKGSVELTATKELTGNRAKAIQDGEFTFTVTEDGSTVSTGKTLEGGEVKFDKISYDQDAIGTHTYLISEDVKVDSNIGYVAKPVEVTVTVSDAGEGYLAAKVTYPEGGAKFVNEYYASGSVALTATKELKGNREKVIGAGEFTFLVTEDGKKVATGETLEGGIIKFTEITYTQADIGTHEYVISEEKGTDATIDYTSAPVTVTVKVSDAGEGQLNTEVAYPEGGAKFVNEYRASGKVVLNATKKLTGNRAAEIGEDEFHFTVMEGDTEVATGATLAGGEVKFTEIQYTQVDIGTHEYVISEDAGEDKSIGYTASPVTVTVKVSDAGEGKLNIETTYPEGGAKFVNEYHAGGSLELTAVKELTGDREEVIQAGEFTFKVSEGSNEVATGETLEGGEVKFTEIQYTQADIGTHTYLISEEAGEDATIGYIADPVTVTVKVSDAGEGKLNIETTYPEGGAKFVNHYYADGTIELAATKVLTGNRAEPIQAGEFTFIVTEDGKTEPVATGETLTGGAVKFTEISYDETDIGTHTYVISEKKGEDPTIEYTTSTVTVTAEVKDAGDGKLKTTVTYPAGGVKFVNQYHASGKIELTAVKELTGNRAEPIQAGEFTFKVTEGSEEVATGETLEGGTVKFTEIAYDETDIGTHTYVISENPGMDTTIGYVAAPVTVTVTVSDAGNGQLKTEADYPEGRAKFVNNYSANGSVELTATKELTGNRAKPIQAGEFTFKVTEGSEEVAAGETLEGGKVKFDEIRYTQADIGTHTYMISEVAGTDVNIGYTASPVMVTVKVSDAGNGKLNTEVTYPEGGAKFVNDYYAIGSVELAATKELTGNRAKPIQAGEFTFMITEGSEEVATGKTLEGGGVKFTKINYTQKDIGTHTYVISEDSGSDKTIGYTASPLTVTVKVSDAGEGSLNTEVTYPEDGAKFVNEYYASGKIELTAVKELTGNRAEPIQAGEFKFEVTETGKTEPVATGETLAGGTVKFDEILYTQADIGIHTYVISEKQGTDKTIGYTAEPVTVTVKVSDAGEGKLNAEATYPTGGAKFVNEYHASGSVKLMAVKNLTGNRTMMILKDEFTYSVKEKGTEVATGSTLRGTLGSSSANISFTEILYTQADIGTHEYVISENSGVNTTISYVAAPVTVTVKVSDAGEGQLNTEVTYPEGGAAFTNEYHAVGSVEFAATKELTGDRAAAIGAGEFTFKVTEGDTEVATGETLAGGAVKFSRIRYTQADIGTHTYVISEEKGNDDTILYTDKTVSVKVTVRDAGQGQLTTIVQYPVGGVRFVNEYHATGSVKLTAKKELAGNRAAEIEENEFNFIVKEDNLVVAEGTTQKGGDIQFDEITYDQADIGTHEYVISEKIGEDETIGYTPSKVNVTVEVSDAGEGNLKTEATYPEGGAKFVNQYYASGSVELTAVKELTGGRKKSVKAGEFTFRVTEGSTEVATGRTQADGTVKFTKIRYTQDDIGTHTYVISENAGEDTSIGYVASPVTVKVIVSDAGAGDLDTKVIYPEGGAKFTNEYYANAEVKLAATKELTGNRAEIIKAGEFTFTVMEGDVQVATGETLAGGVVEFTKIKYTQADIGTHTYVISENAGKDTSIACKAEPITVTVKVSDAGNGSLDTRVTYPEKGAKFVNEYHASGSVELKATKELTGNRTEPIQAGEFTFTVTENETEVATGETLEGGTVKFSEIPYTQDDIGVHTYVISERVGTDETIGYTASPVTVTVKVSDTGEGRLNTKVTYPEGGAKFTNEYHASGSVELHAVKELIGKRAETIKAGEYTFKVTEKNAEVATGETLAGGEVKFSEISYTQADIGTHTYLISENVGKDASVGYVAEPVTVTVKVSDAGEGNLSTEVTYPEGGAKFVNAYHADGILQLAATKKLTGNRAEEIEEGEFAFTVSENGTEVATGETFEGGVVKFSEIVYSQDDIGVHEYVISEIEGEDPSITYTAEPVTVTVEVSDAGKGKLNVEAMYPEEGLTFVNEYHASGSVELTAEKELTGNRAEEIREGEFTFTVTEDGKEVATGETLAGGTVKFTEIPYTQDDIGIHEYVISENQGMDKNIRYTAEPITVTVEVSDAGDGELDVETSYPDGGAKFINEYHASGSVEFTAEKELTGNRAEAIQAGEFTFTVMEDGTEVATGETLEGGLVKFTEITYDQDDIGTHTYVIRENAGEDTSIGYVASPVTVTVAVSDAGEGRLNTKVQYPEGGAKFINEYHASGSVKLHAVKELTGNRAAEIGENEFTFTVKENGTEVATGATLAGGTVKFSEISYTQDDIGTHTYVIRENAGEDTSIGYVASPIIVTVAVSDAGEGRLNTEVMYPEGGAKFINEYHASGSVEFTAEKELTGNRAEAIQAGEFTFTVTEDGKKVATGETLAGGKVKFTEIRYTQDDIGTHTYLIRENAGEDTSIGYVVSPVTVTVAVSDAGEGRLNTEVMYPEGGAKFVNEYRASGSVELHAVKELTGNRAAEIGENEFTFTAKENGTEVATGATLAGGAVKFTEIHYTQDDIGTHTYEIRENAGEDATIGYVAEPVTVTVTVSDAGEGKLHAEATYPKGGAKFVNTYHADGTIELAAMKELTGNRAEGIQAGEFTFMVTEDGTEVATGETLEGGLVKFTEITYDQDDIGTHTYEIRENAGEDAMIGYVAEPVTVTVTVSDAGEGKLHAEATYPEGGAKFVNTYHADGTIELAAMKELTGNRAEGIQAGEFTFTVTEAGKEVATGETLEGGLVKFTEITYDQDDIGTHTYVISENAGEDAAIGYVAEPVTVTVKVSDAGEGKLHAEATYPEGGAKFVNTYHADGTIELAATKELTGNRAEGIQAGEFTFTVTEAGKEVATGETLAGGLVKFTEITYDQDDIGTHTYVISENAGEDAAIGYVAEPVTVTVKVSDAGEGKLHAEATYPEGGAKFINEYHASGSVQLTAMEELKGSLIQDDQFTIELKDEEGTVLQKKENDEEGFVTFDALEYTEEDIGRVFVYSVSEVGAGTQGVTYSTAVYNIQVTVEDNSDGTLETETEITTDDHSVTEMLFENSFEGTVTLQKYGPDEEKLSDVAFRLYQKTEDGWSLYTTEKKDGIYTTDEAGTIKVMGLTENEYYFAEIAAPDGYVTAKEADGSSRKYSFRIGLNEADAYLEVVNEKTQVEIVKQDEEGTPVEGALLRIVDSEGRKIDEWTTDGTAHELTGILIGGQMYQLIEVSAPEGYRIAEDISFTVAADGSTGLITMVDEKETRPVSEFGSAQITKYLTMQGEPLAASDNVFYVALFEDPECTRRVSEIKTLTFKNASFNTAEFNNLEIGRTYYVGETDENGSVIDNGMLETGEIFLTEFVAGQELTAEKGHPTEFSFENQFYTIPAGFYLESELTITKKLVDEDGEDKNSDETFYAGIFDDAAFEQLSDAVPENIVALSLNGESEVSVTMPVAMSESGSRILYVTEVDETGTPVENVEDFPYQVEISDTEVTFTTTGYKAEVIITNCENPEKDPVAQSEIKQETPTVTPEEIQVTTEPETDNTTQIDAGQETETAAQSVKTGDDTPAEFYMLLFAASASISLLLIEERRRRKKA